MHMMMETGKRGELDGGIGQTTTAHLNRQFFRDLYTLQVCEHFEILAAEWFDASTRTSTDRSTVTVIISLQRSSGDRTKPQ